MKSNFTRLQNIISNQLGVDPVNIQSDLDFGDDLGAESLDIVELIMAIEDEFEIDIEDQTANKIRTIQNVLDYIENQQGKKNF